MLSSELIASRPEQVGIDSEMLEALFARARRDVDDGVLPSAQVAVARGGKLAGMRTFGSAIQGDDERPATDETLMGRGPSAALRAMSYIGVTTALICGLMRPIRSMVASRSSIGFTCFVRTSSA